MRARIVASWFSYCLAAALLTACGGGGGGASSLPPVAPPTGGSGAPSSSAPASVAISIAIPSATSASSSLRRVRYISAGTKSASVSYAGTTQTANCDTACNLNASVTPGTVTFALSLYDGSNGTGHVLSTGSTTTTIVAGTSNSVKVTFGAVVATVVVALGTSAVTAGTPATIPVTVTAKDAAGYTVVGSDPYATPITLSTDDASGATSLSPATVTAPGAPVSLAYNGRAGLGAVHVAAAIPGAQITTQPATLTVQNPAPATPPPSAPQPSGSAPAHVKTYYFYGINGVNASIPASWMAAHADYVEDDGDGVQHATAFKNAGGKYAVSYTDPAYVPYCFAPFSGPQATCRGQVGKLVTDESAWLHGADGTRVRRFVDNSFGYQEALNPGSPASQAAYRATTQAILANGPIDYFFADDSGGVFIGDDGTQMTGWMYGFNEPAVEITTDAQFIPANRAMLAAAAKPVIVNGITPYTLQPSYGGAWIDSPNVAAQNYEGCYADGSAVAGSQANRWVYQSNSLLTTYAHHATAVCMMYAQPTPANRIYDMASWWMTYNEQYAVAAPYTSQPLNDGFTVVPEFEIVPRGPLASATSDISALRSATGAYVREFASCYQAGTAIGPCAAVVNPTSSAVAMPALSGHYTTALALDDKSMYSGGKATWTASVPASLAPLSAAILR
ncbi:MAG TPA: hypothetical protein VHS78_00120 [Candidatus Elarobacter sp.]|jgi:hypothetical protein|nr:hypothetical protein [Candidatus Elarobacter sp.]